MYDYRQMSAEERQAIVVHRLSRGFPRHQPPHPRQGHGWYFITAATYEHQRHFSDPRELTALEKRLQEALLEAKLACAGWVVLPNHYHLLLEASDLAIVGRTLGGVHGRSAVYANRRDATPKRRVWYKFSDRKVRSDRHFWACLHYIVINPMRHGYVENPGDWAWSCYAELLAERGEIWLDDLMREYPVLDFGEKWDAPEL